MKIEAEEAGEGEIINIAGIDQSQINNTICRSGEENKLIRESGEMDPPMIMVKLRPNSSPKAGFETELKCSMSILTRRLEEEAELDAALSCEADSGAITLKGRGDLHLGIKSSADFLGILFEKLRREGYEFEITCPQVLKREEDGVELEPVEHVKIEVEEDYVSKIMDRILSRHGVVLGIETLENGRQE